MRTLTVILLEGTDLPASLVVALRRLENTQPDLKVSLQSASFASAEKSGMSLPVAYYIGGKLNVREYGREAVDKLVIELLDGSLL